MIVDLTHTVTDSVPTWDGNCGFFAKLRVDHHECQTQTKFRVHQFTMNAGIGTHLDAPLHCIPNSADISELPLSTLIAPCINIDVSHKADANYRVMRSDLQDFENQHGPIPENAFVAFHTGWSKFWHEPSKYRNDLKFPSIDVAVAEYLVTRKIVGLGIDTLSPDVPENDYPVHQVILGAGLYIVENLANLDQLPPVGSTIHVLPIKIAGATESPVRCFAMLG